MKRLYKQRSRAQTGRVLLALCLASATLASTRNAAAASSEEILHVFGGSDGANPQDGLIAGPNGDFYGTTKNGGASRQGALFKLSRSGVYTLLHSFCVMQNCADGSYPGGLLRDSQGNLYGAAFEGSGAAGYGLIFKYAPAGTYYYLHAFAGPEGARPKGRLIQDGDGNLYGSATLGGASNNGVVYKLVPGGGLTVLHSFAGGSDGADPETGLTADGAGNLFGVTYAGGSSNYGVAFQISSNGAYTILHSFAGADGANPSGSLLLSANGYLYGVAYSGGLYNNGVVFRISPNGAYEIVYSFPGGAGGANPRGALITDSEGNLYGATQFGGAAGKGVAFKLILNRTVRAVESVVYSFVGGSDGGEPVGAFLPVQERIGSLGFHDLYVATQFGGSAYHQGVLSRLREVFR
jgi:uncharacterized repeat protein (TIGR03803 family)